MPPIQHGNVSSLKHPFSSLPADYDRVVHPSKCDPAPVACDTVCPQGYIFKDPCSCVPIIYGQNFKPNLRSNLTNTCPDQPGPYNPYPSDPFSHCNLIDHQKYDLPSKICPIRCPFGHKFEAPCTCVGLAYVEPKAWGFWSMLWNKVFGSQGRKGQFVSITITLKHKTSSEIDEK